MSAFLYGMAAIAFGLSLLSFVCALVAALMKITESCRHNEYQSIGWLACSALMFIAARLP